MDEHVKALLEDLQITRVELHRAQEQAARIINRCGELLGSNTVVQLSLMLASSINAYDSLLNEVWATEDQGARGARRRSPEIYEAEEFLKKLRLGEDQ